MTLSTRGLSVLREDASDKGKSRVRLMPEAESTRPFIDLGFDPQKLL
jgi:hypothetical protein